MVAGLALLAEAARAQGVSAWADDGALRLSVEQALRLAETTSEDVAAARAGLLRASGERLRARSEWLPSVRASAGYERTLASEFEGIFDENGDTQDTTTNGDEAPPFEELPFGRENIWRFGVSLSQNLFAGGRAIARRQFAQALGRSAGAGFTSARAQAVLDAAQAYYDAMLSDRLLAVAEAALQQAEDVLKVVTVERETGAQSEFELLRARVARDNQRPVVVQRRVERDIAYLQLKQLLELPLERPLVLTSELEGESAPVLELGRQIAGVSDGREIERRAVVRQAADDVAALAASLDVVQSQRWPALGLGMQYERVGYPSQLFPSWSDFRDNWFVGVQLAWDVFTGFRVSGETVAAEAELLAGRARLQRLEELARLDGHTAQEQLEAALAAWEASTGVVEEAERAYELAELRYRQGISTQVELTDVRLQLQFARGNRARAARDLQVARMRVALLPALPLSLPVQQVGTLLRALTPLEAGPATEQERQQTPTFIQQRATGRSTNLGGAGP